jgi:DNA-binding protein HU-beta
MKKADLINKVAENTGVSKKQTEEVVNEFMEVIKQALMEGEEVKLVGFGNFEIKEQGERAARDPRDPNKVINIPAKKVVKFKISKKLKNILDEE